MGPKSQQNNGLAGWNSATTTWNVTYATYVVAYTSTMIIISPLTQLRCLEAYYILLPTSKLNTTNIKPNDILHIAMCNQHVNTSTTPNFSILISINKSSRTSWSHIVKRVRWASRVVPTWRTNFRNVNPTSQHTKMTSSTLQSSPLNCTTCHSTHGRWGKNRQAIDLVCDWGGPNMALTRSLSRLPRVLAPLWRHAIHQFPVNLKHLHTHKWY